MADQYNKRQTTPGGVSPGIVIERDGHPSLRFARIYQALPGDVWSAITDHDLMGKWAFAGRLEPRAGGRVDFGTEISDTSTGSVLVWEKPRVLEYLWGAGADAWHVRFELRQGSDSATTLVLEHLLPDPTNAEFAAGWHWHLDRLGKLLRGELPAQVDEDQHFRDLLEYYGR